MSQQELHPSSLKHKCGISGKPFPTGAHARGTLIIFNFHRQLIFFVFLLLSLSPSFFNLLHVAGSHPFLLFGICEPFGHMWKAGFYAPSFC